MSGGTGTGTVLIRYGRIRTCTILQITNHTKICKGRINGQLKQVGYHTNGRQQSIIQIREKKNTKHARTLKILSLFPCFLLEWQGLHCIVQDFSENSQNTENPSNNSKTGIMVTTGIYTNLYIIIAKRVPVYQLPATTRYRTGVKIAMQESGQSRRKLCKKHLHNLSTWKKNCFWAKR